METPAAVFVQYPVSLLKARLASGVTNSDPSTNPFDLSSISPTNCSTAVTGVVPAESWNSVVRSLGSYHAPCSPAENSEAGENGGKNRDRFRLRVNGSILRVLGQE
jgi:hypothetical protein